MKKITALILSIIVMLSFVSCGKEDITEETTTAALSTTEDLTVRVTFPEGYTAKQIAQRLEENDVCSAEDFMALLSGSYYEALSYGFIPGIENTEGKAFVLEGYVFPDTYDFYKGESAEAALARFLRNTDLKLKEEYRLRADELGFTMDEIITLASIIQKEAGDPEKMPLVSSVLHNRIKSPDYGRLQCDVTINYVNDCIVDSPYLEGNTEKYKEVYNTYKCDGLPVGAICNPGLAAIEAALYPADTNYFFFVTDKDWNYYYAETYAEHQKNCKNVGLVG